eukprot:312762-Chlamydomonas_euryale.AAC.1
MQQPASPCSSSQHHHQQPASPCIAAGSMLAVRAHACGETSMHLIARVCVSACLCKVGGDNGKVEISSQCVRPHSCAAERGSALQCPLCRDAPTHKITLLCPPLLYPLFVVCRLSTSCCACTATHLAPRGGS